MSNDVLIALIGAGVSVAVSAGTAVWSYQSSRRLALLEDALDERKSARDAQLDYQYEARKRLYNEFQPLLFQLVELAEAADARITGIAQSAQRGDLNSDGSGWLSGPGYYLFSTIHRLLAPLVLVRLAQRRLTLVDLSLDPQVRFQYAMAKQLYGTWTEPWTLAAASSPPLEYDPNHPEAEERARTEPQIYAFQHVFAGYLDQAIDALTVREDSTARCMSFGEFESGLSDQSPTLRHQTSAFASLFVGFHPQRKPVLWLTLLAQSHIYRALMLALEASDGPVVAPAAALSCDDARLFDWRPRTQT